MAGTDDNPTPITLISLSAARDLVVETLLSAPWAELQIIKWLHLRRVRWQYKLVVGQPAPGRTLEQEAKDLWAQPTRVLVDWQGGCAHRVTVYRKDKAGCLKPARRVTVIGILVVREDIERQLVQMPGTLVGSVAAGNQPKPPQQSPPDPEKWLIPMQAKFAQMPKKQKFAWVRKVAFPKMQQELGSTAPWKTPETLQRVMYPGRRKKN